MSELSGKSKRSIMGSILPKAKPPKADPTDSMSFLDHLEELRWRIIKGVAGILIGIIVAFFFSDFLIKEFILGTARADFFLYQFFYCIVPFYVDDLLLISIYLF